MLNISASKIEREQFLNSYMSAAAWLARVDADNGDTVSRSGTTITEADALRALKADADGYRDIREDCESFIWSVEENEQDGYSVSDADWQRYVAYGGSWAQAGFDFYLSRNGHGGGFKDRGAYALADLARPYGTSEITLSRDASHTLRARVTG